VSKLSKLSELGSLTESSNGKEDTKVWKRGSNMSHHQGNHKFFKKGLSCQECTHDYVLDAQRDPLQPTQEVRKAMPSQDQGRTSPHQVHWVLWAQNFIQDQ